MTGAQFCAGSAPAIVPEIAPERGWSVCLAYSLGGEPVKRTTTAVTARSESAAIRAAIVKTLGGVNRAIHSLEILEVLKR